MLSQQLLGRKAADSSMMVHCHHTAHEFSMMQGHKSLTLRWRSCLGHIPNDLTSMFCLERRAIVRLWVKDAVKPSGFTMMQWQKSVTLCWRWCLAGSSDIVSSIFAHKGCQYYYYGKMPLHSQVIIQDVRPDIIDDPLTLISMTGQCACGLPFSLLSRPIFLLWMDSTMQPGDCWMDLTINHWRSVDAHFYDRAMCVWLAIFPSKPANTSFLDGCDYAAGRLLNRYDYKSLTLR
jgi:hypothetical protein